MGEILFARRRRSGVGDCVSDPAREDASVRLRPEPRPASGPSGAPSSAQSGARRPAPRPGPGRRARIGCPSFGPRTEETRRGSPRIVRIRRRGAAIRRSAPRRRPIPKPALPAGRRAPRLVARAGIDDGLAHEDTRANWYSIRRTFADWLDERVSDAAISAVMGHFEISSRTRHQLFDAGSPTTDIYKRRKLGPVLEVAKVLDEEWWPSIQPFTSVDLRNGADRLMRTDATD